MKVGSLVKMKDEAYQQVTRNMGLLAAQGVKWVPGKDQICTVRAIELGQIEGRLADGLFVEEGVFGYHKNHPTIERSWIVTDWDELQPPEEGALAIEECLKVPAEQVLA